MTRRRDDISTDLFGESGESDLQRLIDNLAELHAPEPSPPDVRASIERAIDDRLRSPAILGRRAATGGFRDSHRVVKVAALGVSAFVLLGAAPSIRSRVEQALLLGDDTRVIIERDLGSDVSLSQSVHGFTVTIERVYADTDHVIIAYSIAGQPGHTYQNFHPHDVDGSASPTLHDARGNELSLSPTSWGSGVESGEGGYVLVFDASGVATAEQVLILRLELPALTVIEKHVHGETPPMPWARVCTGDVCTFTVPGPFTFDLTVQRD